MGRNLTDSVIASNISRLDVGGTLSAAVTCGQDSSDTGGTFYFTAGGIATSGSLEARAGNIFRAIVSGNMLGDLYAPNGQIRQIVVTGDIGSTSRTSTITARSDATLGEKFELISATNIYANITGTATNSWLGRLETSGSPGVFVGSITANHFPWEQTSPTAGVYLNGNLDANLTFQSVSMPIVIGGSLLAGKKISIAGTMRTYDEPGSNPDRFGQIRIGGSLLGDIEIGTGAHYGLQGFVIINENNSGGIWDSGAEVKLNTPGLSGLTALSPRPAYDQLSSQLTPVPGTGGGVGEVGAVGLVPFRLHATDCEPAHGETVDHCSPPTEIRMRHYGPVVDWDPETDPAPFSVWRRRIGTSNSWIEHSDCFSQERDATNATIVVLTSSVAMPSGYEYKVSLVQDSGENILRCDTPGQPEVADHTSDFIFTVGVDSPGDANGDGKVDFDDIASVNANWQMTNCLQLGDADRDGDVDFDDISSVITNWLNEYATCEEEMMMAGFGEGCDRTMEDAIAAMAFESATEYAVFLAELSEGELVLILKAVDEWLNCER